MARLSDKQLRWILTVFACFVGFYQCGLVYMLATNSLWPQQRPNVPFLLKDVRPEIESARKEAADAGLKENDRIISIQGLPYQGLLTLGQALAHVKSGDKLQVVYIPSGTPEEKTAVIELQPHRRRLPSGLTGIIIRITVEFFLKILIPCFCIALGFVVAFLRPRDIRSWILLGLMLCFSAFFVMELVIPRWGGPWFWGFLLIRTTGNILWPFFMVLFGLHFPERIPTRALHLTAWLFGIPMVIRAVLQLLFDYGRFHYLPLAEFMRPYIVSQGLVFMIFSMVAVGWSFALLGMQNGIAKTADAKRRARLLNLGTHASFAPMFGVVLYTLFTKRDFFDMPPLIGIFALTIFALFPVQLAYVILVYRALDIRVVLRIGLQYAMAKGGIRILEVAFVGLAIYALLELDDSNTARVLQLLVCGVALAVIFLAKKLRTWVDRRFFRESYDSEKLLTELGENVRAIVNPQELLETLARRISDSLHVPSIAVLQRNGNSFHSAFALGFPSVPSVNFPPDSPVINRIRSARHPQTVYVDDPRSWINREVNATEKNRLRELQTQLLLPLHAKKGLLGFISLGPKLSEEPYNPTDLRLLRALSSQAGLALENSMLTAEVAQELAVREQLSREMSIAREVQQRLFPHKLPAVQGVDYAGSCRPAQSVGGDYYDFIELDDGKIAFAVGDVSGKGMPAALLMSALQASVRGQAMNDISDLRIFMRNVNRLIYDMSPKSHFATLFYAIYDPSSKLLRYSNGGHNRPMLLQASGNLRTLETSGPGVGMSRGSTYKQSEVQLFNGDLLVAFTDGFTEAMNASNDEFGDERFAEAIREGASLRADAIRQHLISATDRFIDGAAQHDDMTLIVWKVE